MKLRLRNSTRIGRWAGCPQAPAGHCSLAFDRMETVWTRPPPALGLATVLGEWMVVREAAGYKTPPDGKREAPERCTIPLGFAPL